MISLSLLFTILPHPQPGGNLGPQGESAFNEDPVSFPSLINPALHPHLEDDDLSGAWGALLSTSKVWMIKA